MKMLKSILSDFAAFLMSWGERGSTRNNFGHKPGRGPVRRRDPGPNVRQALAKHQETHRDQAPT